MTEDYFDSDIMGGGVKPAQFKEIGDRCTIVVEFAEQRVQTDPNGNVKTFQDGKPRPLLYVTGMLVENEQTDDEDDDQMRALYIQGQMWKATREAIRQAGAKGVQKYAKLQVILTGYGEKTNPAYSPPKIYTVRYAQPEGAPMATMDASGDEPAPAPAPTTNGRQRSATSQRAQEVRAAAAASVNPDDIPF